MPKSGGLGDSCGNGIWEVFRNLLPISVTGAPRGARRVARGRRASLTVHQKIAWERMMAENDTVEDFLEEFAVAQQVEDEDQSHYLDSRQALALSCIGKTFSPALIRKINRDPFCSVILEVPWSDWVAAVTVQVRKTFPRHHVVVSDNNKKPKSGQDLFAATAAWKGGFFAVVVSGTTSLTDFAERTASIRKSICKPDLGVLRRVARLSLKGDARKIRVAPTWDWPHLTEVAACFPPGAPVDVAVQRLTAFKMAPKAVPARKFPDLADIHGLGGAQTWARDLQVDMAAFRRGELDFSDINSGAILAGPPGTGKTWFAGAVAQACELHFVPTSIGSWFATSGGHLDDVIKAMRGVFNEAKACSPSLVFIDELDALPARGTLDKRGKSWWTPVITDFLNLLDSVLNDRSGIIVLGATNRVFDIDEAVKRKGRLAEILQVEAPDPKGLEGILRYHLRNDLIEADLGAFSIAMTGCTGADAAGWARDARRIARNAGRAVTLDDLWLAACGKETRSAEDLWKVAVHEAGHCVVGRLLDREPQYVSIRRTSQWEGETRYEEVSSLISRPDVIKVVTTTLAGMAAEQLILGDNASIGAGGMLGSDLHLATEIVTRGYACFGWGEALAWRGDPEKVISLLTADRELRAIVNQELKLRANDALALIERHKAVCEALAKHILRQRSLDRSGIDIFFSASGL